jgi:predicted XRE-type DNA-binding protein
VDARDKRGHDESNNPRFGIKEQQPMAKQVQVEAGSDNIFADLGLPDAETHLLKAQIVSEIYRLTRQRKLTQAQAGKRLGISQPEVSRMFRGNFREYSVDRLMEFLTRFDRDVEIVVKPHKKTGRQGRITFIRPAA